MAYAALVSLKHKINRSVKCYHDLIMPELVKLGTILRKLDGTKNRSNRNAINALDAGIREEVWKLEDLLECQVLYPPHSICRCYYSHRSSSKQEIYELTETLKKLGEVYATEVYRKLSGEEEDDVVSAIEDLAGKNSKKVGLWDEVEKILNDLVDPQSGSKTVSIVGMAGIGKSHIASEIFHHPIIAQHFDLLVWVSVGPQKETKNVWLKVLGEVESKSKETNVIKAAGLLRERLRGRRHLTVLDDVWSRVECHSLIRLLHGNGTQGRVLITTRLEQVAKDLDSSIHHLRFLNNEESWDLLWHNVFGGKSAFPLQLEKSGRKIAEKCEGLPLLILAVAHILSQLDTTLEYWNKVAHDKTTTFPEAYDKIHKVLYSSFEYLPQYLKPCFLYMGVFPQTSEVPLSKLINLLTVEDFMEPELRLTPVMKTLKPREAQPMPTLQTLATALRGKSTLGSLASVPRTDGKSYAPKREISTTVNWSI